MKVKNDLLGYENLKIIQDTDYFSFSLDSVLLPNFVRIDKKCKRILDIGTGNAPIPLILSTKTKAKIVAIEVQKEIYDMAVETIEMNNLSNQIELINDDVNNIGKYYDSESFDIILSNPPYFKTNNLSKRNDNPIKAIARHEILLNLNQLIQIVAKYLKNDGVFSMVYRTDRMVEVLKVMSENKLEPKRILLIFPKEGKESNLFLVEGVKNARVGLKEVKSLIAHDNSGNYSKEVLKYFS